MTASRRKPAPKSAGLAAATAAALAQLEDWLRRQPGVAVAFSGGMDSGFLALAAHRIAPEKTVAIFADHELLAGFDRERAHTLAARFGLTLRVAQLSLLTDVQVRSNPPDRCYWCKRVILRALAQAVPPGWTVAEGSQADDVGDYRPGRKALEEAGITSPLLAAGFTKERIAEVLRHWGAAELIAPARPCVATRFAAHTPLSEAGVARVIAAEEALADLGLTHLRVRDHGELARIEVAHEDIDVVLQSRELVVTRLTELGYRHVSLDLAGYRRGSMNRP